MSFEEHIRRNLNNHHSEVDTDALWNSIKDDIPTEKEDKRRRFLFFFTLISVSLGSIFILSQGDLDDPTYLSTKVEITTPSISSIEKYIDNVDTDAILSITKNTKKKRNLSQSKEFNKPLVKRSSTSKIKKANNSSSTIHKPTIVSSSNLNHSIPTDIQNQKFIEVLKDQIRTILPKQKEEELNIFAAELHQAEMIQASLLPEIAIEELEVPEVEDLEYEETEEIRAAFDDERDTKFTFGFSLGSGKVNNTFSPNFPSQREYVDKLNRLQKSSYYIDYSFDLMMAHKSGVYLKSGFLVQKNKTVFNPNSTLVEEVIQNQIPNLNVTGTVYALENGNQNEREETQEPVTTVMTSVYSRPQSLKSKSLTQTNYALPIILGYQFGKGNFKIGVETGVMVNLFSKIKGNINTPYKEQWGINLQQGLSLSYDITPEIALNLAGQYRFTPSSVTESKASYSLKQKSYGINLGLKFNISE